MTEKPESEKKTATQELAELLHCEVKPQLDLVLDCINKGANPNAKSPDGTTFLMVACMTKQHPLVIEALIKAGADVHATNESGFTALFGACQPFDDVTKQLANEVLRIDSINILLQAGADINHQTGEGPDPDDRFERSYLTPLQLAAGPDSVKVVEFMLANGSNPNMSDGLKRTPLFAAVASGDIELARVLIEGGADINSTCIHHYYPATGEPVPVTFELNGIEGETNEIYPLDLAVMEEEHDMATMLLGIGAQYTPGLTQLEISMVYEPSSE